MNLDIEFKSVDNMKKCLPVFERYMNDKYNVNVNDFKDSNPRVILYTIMANIEKNDAHRNLPIKELNNMALNDLRDYYITKYTIVASNKPNVRPLDRERQIHGERHVTTDVQIKPMNTDKQPLNDIEREFTRIMNVRKAENDPTVNIDMVEKPQTEKPMTKDEFQLKMTEIENMRNDVLTASIEIQKGQDTSDPKVFYDKVLQANDVNKREAEAYAVGVVDSTSTYNRDIIPVMAKLRKSPTYYAVVNGFDRDWFVFKKRFQFSIDMSRMSRTYRNVHEMAFTKLIIPSEIVDERTVTNIPKTSYVHNFRFGFPYLILIIDEFQDVYDGINPASKRAFTQFIFDSTYTAPNGRGYIIMKSAQDEKKVFYPSPLSSLQRMTLTIAKPNGVVFNTSDDSNTVWKVEYELYNQKHLKIVLERYFDKNEFFVGDTVMFRNFRMPLYTAVTDEEKKKDPEYIEYASNMYMYDKIMTFINRPEGHEIAEIGQPNDEGFYRTFYIYAPMTLDSTIGKNVVEKPIVDQIVQFNEKTFTCITKPVSNGMVMNTSLQVALSMQVKLAIGDAVDALTPQII